MKKLNVFIVLFCFWDGDGYFTNGYETCCLSINDCLEHISEKEEERKQSILNGMNLNTEYKPLKIYFPGEELSENDPVFDMNQNHYQIIKKKLI